MAGVASSPRRTVPFVARSAMLLALSFVAMVRPAMAQEILRDAETEALFRDMARPLIEAAGLRPDNVQIVLLQDREINAFVAGGQIVYLQSGLIVDAQNVNEVQGVVAHELGHITGGHIVRMADGARAATGISLLSLLIGAAAVAAGAGDAGIGAVLAGQQAAMGSFLAFNRTQEASADQAAVTYLHRAGISGRGLLAFFGRLQNMEYRMGYSADVDSYAQTHPLTGDRIQLLQHSLEGDAAWSSQTDPALEARFERVRAKLIGYVQDPQRVLAMFPQSDQSVPARYARAYAWHRAAHPDRALAEADSLLNDAPNDPFFLELKGQILLESGHPREAVTVLRHAVAAAPDQPLISALFGHALISTEDPANFDEAEQVLKIAVQRDNSNPFAWYQLGIIYDRVGDAPRAALATAERYNLENQPRLALVNAEQAMMGLRVGTPDWLRAQDIAMVSRTAAAQQRRRNN